MDNVTDHAGERAALGGRGKKRGLIRVVVALRPNHLEEIRREAMTRMAERGVGKMDSGEIVREALDDAPARSWRAYERAVAAGDPKAAGEALSRWVALTEERQAQGRAQLAKLGAWLDEMGIAPLVPQTARRIGEQLAKIPDEWTAPKARRSDDSKAASKRRPAKKKGRAAR